MGHIRKSDDRNVQRTPLHLAMKSKKKISKNSVKKKERLPFANVDPDKTTLTNSQHKFEVRPVKVKTNNSLTYRNVSRDIVGMLRTRLNRKLPAWDADVQKKILPPVNKTLTTSCTFLSGSVGHRIGICSKYGACRLKEMEFTENEDCNIEPMLSRRTCVVKPIASFEQKYAHGFCNTHGQCVSQDTVRWNHLQCIMDKII